MPFQNWMVEEEILVFPRFHNSFQKLPKFTYLLCLQQQNPTQPQWKVVIPSQAASIVSSSGSHIVDLSDEGDQKRGEVHPANTHDMSQSTPGDVMENASGVVLRLLQEA